MAGIRHAPHLRTADLDRRPSLVRSMPVGVHACKRLPAGYDGAWTRRRSGSMRNGQARLAWLLAVGAAAVACSGAAEGERTDSLGDGLRSDAATDGRGVPEAVDARIPELKETANRDGPDRDEHDLCGGGAGCFGDPCEEGADCMTGLCMPHLGDKVCSQTCVEECPVGWDCVLLSGLGPDPMYVCLSTAPTLCWPCAGSSDCKVLGGNDACVEYGPEAGNFCGASCAEHACPEGFVCQTATSTEAKSSKQCLPVAEECACSAWAREQQLSTPCVLESEFGSCPGQRACGPGGLSACSAPVPMADTCDGQDNECDGATDEGILCDDGNECTQDECQGEDGCENAVLSGTACFDGDLCTEQDHCASGTCVGLPMACDDGEICTVDTCVAGECAHSPGGDG